MRFPTSALQFDYNGHSRIVEPFACGISTADNYVLGGFQIRGSDKSKPLCWRLYELADMSQYEFARTSGLELLISKINDLKEQQNKITKA